MKSFIDMFSEIKDVKPQKRGLLFEKLFYKIFDKNNILIEKSYKNENNSQQIDGAIEINNRIFLLEIKWEKSKTLAASKLYSFLGKLNSKIEGTIGIFISYNSLSDNFVSSVRAGIKQNCIIIHGKENILPIINEEINLINYIWYIYQQAATKNRVTVPISEFDSLPRRTEQASVTDWNNIYTILLSGKTEELRLLLDKPQVLSPDLSSKFIALYPIIRRKKNIRENFNFLFDILLDHQQAGMQNAIIKQLTHSRWTDYTDEIFYDKIKAKIRIESEMAKKIMKNIMPYFVDNYGDWEKENEVSLVFDFIYDSLQEDLKKELASKYIQIYSDTSRREYFAQKKFAIRIFSSLNPDEIYRIAKDGIMEYIKDEKQDYEIFEDNSIDEKEYIKRQTKKRFKRIIEKSEIDWDEEFKILYNTP